MIWIYAITILAFSYCWKCKFVSDDIQGITPEQIYFPIKRGKIILFNIFDRLWFKLFQRKEKYWHLVVLGYHLIVLGLFYLLCNKLFGRQIAIISTLLFSIHPCNNQGVLWVSGRNYTITACLVLGVFLFSNNPFVFLPLFYLGVIIHSQMAMLPLVLFAYKPNVIHSIYLVAVLPFIPMYLKLIALRIKNANWDKDIVKFRWVRLNMIVKIINYYFFMAIVPFRLGFYHSSMFGYNKAIDKFNLKTIFGVIGIAIFTGLSIIARKELPLFSFGLLWFAVFLIPCLNIIYTNMMFSERYMYIPLFGFCIALAQVLVLFPHYDVILAVILTLYFIRTVSYSMAYEDEFKLFGINLRNQPKSLEAHINLGDRWLKANRSDIALPLFQRGVDLDTGSDIAWFNLGCAQHNLGYVLEAKKSWERSLEINPKYVNPRFNLIRLEKRMEEMKKKGQWIPVANVETEMAGIR